MKSCISLIFDKNVVVPAAVLIQSICDNYYDNDDLDVVCCIPNEDKSVFEEVTSMVKLPPRINLKLVPITAKKFPWSSEVNKTSTHQWPPIERYKVFLGSLLSDYDKTIYLDTDMLVVKNIQPILDHPMYSKFMAVPDVIGTEFHFLKSRGETSYLNTGLMIIDLNWWREAEIEKIMLDHLKNNPYVRMATEELCNTYLKKYWHPLPFSFNFYAFSRNEFEAPNYDESSFLPTHYNHATIIHFAGLTKPWTYKEMIGREDSSLLGEKWRRMAKAAEELKESRNHSK
jgi:lipopolysaccharide biosynthesis glycosyltransferase